jgi:NhaA family Na+:H+ antiporter
MRTRSSLVERSSRLLEFLRTEEASGLFLLGATVVALVWVNSPLRESYEQLWGTVATVRIQDLSISMDLQHWVNEGLMTLFFLVVGLEIKRELTAGELREPKAAALPALAALGGMVVPAGMFVLLNAGRETAGGWGVPVATDIAFALGVLTLAASRAPVSVRSFLLTLAIVDDIGAILVIAFFYSDGIAVGWLGVAALIVLLTLLARLRFTTSVVPYIVLGTALWVALFESGIHPTLTGVVLGLLAPALPLRRSPTAGREARQLLRRAADETVEGFEAHWIAIDGVAKAAVSPVDRVESSLHPWTSRVVVPTFALANAGVELSETALSEAVTSPLGLGIILGLIVGKPLGIGAAVWAATSTGIARLPSDASRGLIVGAAVLAGIGFTVALFIAELALGHDVETAKLAVLIASLVAGLLGAAIVRREVRRGDAGIGR